ncbi:DUF6858 family protein [Sedimenticola hydrogenitrophicus]|uniref:DUF6858 family protein n=1 Tax=Sedimenticola hydrogenitrophicus TaxID=2967975 RepID=UPI0023B0304A|nr:hypothetical protein [Sedimenticola hydrogenitrophicus]
MQQSLTREAFSLFSLEIGKSETTLSSVDQILDHLKGCIEADPAAVFIATFDHYAHTRALPNGQIHRDIRAASNIIFCFGLTLPTPQAMALRPRSIGVVELPESFHITFMEAPMPVANTAMESWARSVRNRENHGSTQINTDSES